MANIINIKIIENYIDIQKKLPLIIRAYDLNISKLAKYSGMSRPTFYKKMKCKTFLASELILIVKYINRDY